MADEGPESAGEPGITASRGRCESRAGLLVRRLWLVMPLAYGVLIVLGALGLKAPAAAMPGPPLTWLEAAFTATSAVCGSGLSVLAPSSRLTPVGQAVVLALMELGALVTLALGAMVLVLACWRLKGEVSGAGEAGGCGGVMRHHGQEAPGRPGQLPGELPGAEIAAVVRFALVAALVCQGVGALALGLFLQAEPWPRQVGLSLFHAVSAFSNTGLTLLPEGMEPWRYSMAVHLVIAPLIVLGGLGGPVLLVLWQRIRRRYGGASTWPAYAKLVLVATAVLYLVGVIGLMGGQLTPHLAQAADLNVTANRADPGELTPRRVGSTLADASFLSLSARSAGFETQPMEELTPASRLVLILLMLAGGAPGGTAGGVTILVLALAWLGAAATLRQSRQATAFGWRIPRLAFAWAATMSVWYLATAALVVGLLSLFEAPSLFALTFEGISALTLAGLSLGITPDLTTFGKCVLMGAMLLGRVGPLVLLAVMVGPGGPRRRG